MKSIWLLTILAVPLLNNVWTEELLAQDLALLGLYEFVCA